jgi:uncharacterized protein (TIGR00251 family)
VTRLRLRVSPRAKRNAVLGLRGDTLKVSVTAVPERGKANDAVVDVIAGALGVPRSRVRIVAGETAPLKTVDIDGDDAVLAKLPPK